MSWDLVVVGAGPAGSATALGALRAQPGLRVALLDRADFPRDKACGDGIAPQAVDLLREAGATEVVTGHRPVPRLRLSLDGVVADGEMARPTWVVPRAVFDQRLVTAAQEAGATLLPHRVRSFERSGPDLTVDGRHRARVLVGADGASSVVRRALGVPRPTMAVALRGYAPTPPGRDGCQQIVFGTSGRPSYAWAFDRGDGLANVGYGELLPDRAHRPTRADLLAGLSRLIPDVVDDGRDWRGARLPLSGWRWRPAKGPVLLAGDAAALVNPMTGEGIFHAVASGLAAGRAAAEAIAADAPETAGERYRAATRHLLGGNLPHTATAARLCRHDAIITAGLRASARDRRVFDDLVELGLARGRITPTVVRGLARALVGHHVSNHMEGACES
ncbi:MAG TPA: geranylgeranyl reductase family protein [Motilibacteraceae bacterium]|nr:geranylgeranyl reductase family protein [Motilibacteraceae bacterium]